MSQDYWKSVIQEAKKRSLAAKTRSGSGTAEMTGVSHSGLEKRWFGKFLGWLKKLNKVEAGNDGFLTMLLKKSFLLYRAEKG